jgi:hypothetical protein
MEQQSSHSDSGGFGDQPASGRMHSTVFGFGSPTKKRVRRNSKDVEAHGGPDRPPLTVFTSGDVFVDNKSDVSNLSQSQDIADRMSHMHIPTNSQYSIYSASETEYYMSAAHDDGTRDGFSSFMGGSRIQFTASQSSAENSGDTQYVPNGDSRDMFDISHAVSDNSRAMASLAAAVEAPVRFPPRRITAIQIPNPFLPPKPEPRPLSGLPMHRPLSSPRDTSIFASMFDPEFTLGRGAFAEVQVARKRLDGTLYAVKKLRAVITGEATQRRFLNEVFALSALRGCPSIIQYFDSWIDNGNLWISTELCLKETLLSFLVYGSVLSSRMHVAVTTPTLTPHFNSMSGWEADDGSLSNASGGLPPRGVTRELHRNLSVTSTGSVAHGAVDFLSPGGYKIGEPLAWVIIETIGQALAFMHEKGKFSPQKFD